jgi:hypothetical protein
MTDQGLKTVPVHTIRRIRVTTDAGEIEGELKSIFSHISAETGAPGSASTSEDAEGTDAPPPA